MIIIKKLNRPLFVLFLALLFISLPCNRHFDEFPTYRVIIDPGHGGYTLEPMSKHGDRFDAISKTFLSQYSDGASYGSITEDEVMYSIAKKVQNIISECGPEGDFAVFKKILLRYARPPLKQIIIKSSLSRGQSPSRSEAIKAEDPNAPFRLFDYPDKNNRIQKGRISHINYERPHLVVSLHAASATRRDYQAINPVIVPPWELLDKGMSYLRGKCKDRSFFYSSSYRHWFIETVKRTDFSWFLNDTATYYTGYPLTINRKPDKESFMGYRYNMVQWAYSDPPGWEQIAATHPVDTPYDLNPLTFSDNCRFFDREKSIYESYRRARGPEGFGGDNCYASYELIRYILLALKKHSVSTGKLKPGKPYISTWSMPLHVNAINPFLELGYFRRRTDRRILTRNHDEIAEGIAVGIYSLLAGVELKNRNFKHAPRGKRIDLEKYKVNEEETYFNQVIP